MVAGADFASTLNQEPEAKMPMTKNISDILNKKGTGTKSAVAASSCTEEILQEDTSGLAKLIPVLSNEANALADGEKQEGKGEEVKRLRGKDAKTFTFSPFHLFTFSPFLPLIMDESNRHVTEAPADSTFTRFKIPNIQAPDANITNSPDFLEHKSNAPPDLMGDKFKTQKDSTESTVETSNPNFLNFEFRNLDLSSLNPDNYSPKQEKEIQPVYVPVLSKANVEEQILTKGPSEQPPANLPHPLVLQPFQKSIQINNQKQDSNLESLRGVRATKQSGIEAITSPPAHNDAQENGINNHTFILNRIQPGMNIAEPEIKMESKTRPVLHDIIPSAQQASAYAEYRGVGALSTPETIVEEITYPRTATGNNNTTTPQEELVSLLEKPIVQQSKSTVSLKASQPMTFDLVRPYLLLTPLSTTDESMAPSEPETNPLSKQAHTAKREIGIAELSKGENQVPQTNFPPLKAELLEIDPLNHVPRTWFSRNLNDTQTSPSPITENLIFILPEDKVMASPVRGSMLYNIMPANPDNLVTLEASNGPSEANNKLSLLNRLQHEIYTTEPKIMIKGVISQYVVASNDTVEVIDANIDAAKEFKASTGTSASAEDGLLLTKPITPKTIIASQNTNNINPQDIVLPSRIVLGDEIELPEPSLSNTTRFFANAQNDKNKGAYNDNLMESSAHAYREARPVKTSPLEPDFNNAAGKNPLTQPTDSKISANTQTETKPEIVKTDTSNPPIQRADVKHYVETQDVASPHKEEIKTVDLSLPKGKLTPDEQHKNLPTNPITNLSAVAQANDSPLSEAKGQNAGISTLALDGSASQSAKDVSKMSNPQQIPESHYNNIIEQIAQKVRLYLREGRSDIRLRLEPPELGHIKLKFSVTGNRLEASIEVENLNVMRAIERDIPRLKESISSAGIDVGRLDVLCHEGNDGYHKPYFAQHTDPKIQSPTEEDTDIESVEKADKGLTITGINNALDIGRIDYIV